MNVLILGVDGYLGWPLAQHLVLKGHRIGGLDSLSRRFYVQMMGGGSALPIEKLPDRVDAFTENYGQELDFRYGSTKDYDLLEKALEDFQPDAIVHLAENPSAAYSMMSARHAAEVQSNNVIGTLNLLHAIQQITPDAHLVKLGTMGEYGTPDIDIPEGFFEVEYRGRKATLPFPRQAGSWYHLSKVHDSHNIKFACDVWGLKSTDIMQGVVYGTRLDGIPDDTRLNTRLDFDGCFGTIINRFCCQAVIGHPLTVYGTGQQKRGFLPLRDSMQCLTLALENPPEPGEYRVLNQFMEVFSIIELAKMVHKAAGDRLALDVEIKHIDNPRTEQEDHYYNPDHEKLAALGYAPDMNMDQDLDQMLVDLMPHKDRIEAHKKVLRIQSK